MVLDAEAVWTRFFPIAREVRDFVKNGHLGQVMRVWADVSFWNDAETEFGNDHRMVNMDLAGGALLDRKYGSVTQAFEGESVCAESSCVRSGCVLFDLDIPNFVSHRAQI